MSSNFEKKARSNFLNISWNSNNHTFLLFLLNQKSFISSAFVRFFWDLIINIKATIRETMFKEIQFNQKIVNSKLSILIIFSIRAILSKLDQFAKHIFVPQTLVLILLQLFCFVSIFVEARRIIIKNVTLS